MRLKQAILPVLITILAFTGCSNVQADKKPEFGGKFAFNRLDHQYDLKKMIIINNEDQKKIELGLLAAHPKWSSDRKNLVLSNPDVEKIYIIDNNGELQKEIPAKLNPSEPIWSKDSQKIYYVSKVKVNRKIPDRYSIISYDLKEDKHTELKTLEVDHEIRSLVLSPDGNTIAFRIGTGLGLKNIPTGVYLLDLKTKDHIKIWPMANPRSWYPDNKHLLIRTNVFPDGSPMNKPYGVLAKVNIETKEYEIIHVNKHFYFQTRLSDDGKYIYYTRRIPNQGQAVFVRELATNKEWQISQPELIDGKYSIDFNVDWHQG